MKRLPRENIRGLRGRATPPTPGSALRQLRLERGLSQDEVSRFYTEKGCTVARISQIENAERVNVRIESCYRGAIAAAELMRKMRREMSRARVADGR